MDAILQWGIELIAAIQQIQGPVLNGIFRAITFMGDEEFFLLLLPLLLWCVDYAQGARVAVLFLLSHYLNVGLKDVFQQPRPCDLVPSMGLIPAEGCGLPSGHAQGAVVVWGSIAAWARKAWFWVVAVTLMVLIGFSRIYLGVHFPTDVLAGWAIGVLLLGLYLALQPPIARWLATLGLGVQVLLALALPLALILIHPTKDTTSVMAPLAGIGVGLALARRYVPFHAGGPWWQRIVRFLVGGVVVFALYMGLRAVFPGEGAAFYLFFRSVRYGLVGVWASLGAPWLFRVLRLAPVGSGEA